MEKSADITALLDAARSGREEALNDLFDLVYGELRRIARSQRRRWHGDHTLDTSALIHEAYLKLSGREAGYKNRSHFYATAARAMRHILVNYAERGRASKRGGGADHVPLDEGLVADDATALELLTLHRALEGLERDHPRACRVVECRVFGGMSHEELAEALQISVATVKRDWNLASAALYRELNPSGGPGDESDPG